MSTRPITPLGASLALLGIVLAFALGGLALDGNWPKVLRVGLAGITYGTALSLALASGRTDHSPVPLPWWPFGLAGACAGAVSGLVRPALNMSLLLASTAGAALLLGTFHWVALRWWPVLHRHIAG